MGRNRLRSDNLGLSPRIASNCLCLGPMPTLNNPFGQGIEIVSLNRCGSGVSPNPRTEGWGGEAVSQGDDEQAETMSITSICFLK